MNKLFELITMETCLKCAIYNFCYKYTDKEYEQIIATKIGKSCYVDKAFIYLPIYDLKKRRF